MKKNLSIGALERLPKDPREIVFLDLPTEKILGLCARSTILKQTCSDDAFWWRKLENEDFFLGIDRNIFNKFIIYWKPAKMTEAEFLISICSDGKVLSDYFYSIDNFLEIQQLISTFLHPKRPSSMPPSFPLKELNSLLSSLTKLDLDTDELIKWNFYRGDLNFIYHLIERRRIRKNDDEHTFLTIQMPLYSSFPNLEGTEYLSQLDDPEFEFDDDLSYNPEDNDEYGNDDFTRYIGRETSTDEMNETVIRWMKILKKYLKEGDILSYLNPDRKGYKYFYVYFVGGKPYLQKLIEKKNIFYLPSRGFALLQKLKPETDEDLENLFQGNYGQHIMISGFTRKEDGEILFYEMSNKRGKLTKITDDWSIYQIDKKPKKSEK